MIKHKLIAPDITTGMMNKYVQLKTVTPTKRIPSPSPQATKGMSFNVSLLSPASCQARTSANSS